MKTMKYFSATWCGPCKTFKPIMNEIAGEGYSVQVIDIDQQQDLAARYNVRSVPTTIIEENGIEVDRIIGSVSKQQVLSKLLQMKLNLPNSKYIIYEQDILDILIAFNDGNYEWILDFFESLRPLEHMEELDSYTFEQLIANAGIVSHKGK